MQTIKQIERMWTERQYQRLFRELISLRPEAQFAHRLEAGPMTCPATAMAIIRLDELNQAYVPLYDRLVRCLLAAQEADGGWGDPAVTALCVRALLAGRGSGEAIDRGLAYLANLQKDNGIWPAVPFRRLPEDAAVSAFITHQLGDQPRFQTDVAFDEVLQWFEQNAGSLDALTQKLWNRATLRCRLGRPSTHQLHYDRRADYHQRALAS